ncbi:MAG: hypothetical protein WCR02_00705 [Sphaerochaetaceae bacterium]
MLNNYRIYRSRQDLEQRIRTLHDNPLLAVGLLDVSTAKRLEETLSWYVQNLGYAIHVITQNDKVDIHLMQEKFPSVTFILFTSEAFSGEKINVFANECKTNYFLVVRTDCDLIRFDGLKLFALLDRKDHPSMVCPVLANSAREIVPCVRIPKLEKQSILCGCSFPNMLDDTKVDTLYPVMGLGLYDRALFQRLRGYDEQIHSEYWQVLDWGIRCWLLGYPLYLTQALLVQFPTRLSLIEDLTEVEGYKRCCTKALTVVQVNGKNVARKIKKDYDRDAMRQEVKSRLLWLQKQDYRHLVSFWVESEESL